MIACVDLLCFPIFSVIYLYVMLQCQMFRWNMAKDSNIRFVKVIPVSKELRFALSTRFPMDFSTFTASLHHLSVLVKHSMSTKYKDVPIPPAQSVCIDQGDLQLWPGLCCTSYFMEKIFSEFPPAQLPVVCRVSWWPDSFTCCKCNHQLLLTVTAAS